MSPRAAITVVFFVNGALFASWASRIPALSDRVGATTGVLGLALLAPAVGAVVAMPLVGRLLPGRSSRVFCRVAVAGLMAAILLPGTALVVLLAPSAAPRRRSPAGSAHAGSAYAGSAYAGSAYAGSAHAGSAQPSLTT